MLAYRLFEDGPRLSDAPVPTPGDGEVLVKIAGAGACHSDLHVIDAIAAGNSFFKPPFTLGHENTGWVEAIGPGVRGVEIGEAVAIYCAWGCGRCRMCARGSENYCMNQKVLLGGGLGNTLNEAAKGVGGRRPTARSTTDRPTRRSRWTCRAPGSGRPRRAVCTRRRKLACCSWWGESDGRSAPAPRRHFRISAHDLQATESVSTRIDAESRGRHRPVELHLVGARPQGARRQNPLRGQGRQGVPSGSARSVGVGQAQDPLGDDVVLDLLRAAVDRARLAGQPPAHGRPVRRP